MKPGLRSLAVGMTLAVAAYGITTTAHAATTKGGYPICFQKEWLEDLMKFLAENDRSSYEAYFDTRKCLMARAGIKLTIIESPGVLGSMTGFIADGVKGWTLREAIDYKK